MWIVRCVAVAIAGASFVYILYVLQYVLKDSNFKMFNFEVSVKVLGSRILKSRHCGLGPKQKLFFI